MKRGRSLRSGRLIVLSMLLAVGCVDVLVGSNPATTPGLALYDQVWNDIDQHYALLEEKNIDWAASYQRYLPRAKVAPSIEFLAPVLGDLIAELHDLHVDLVSPGGRRYLSVDTRLINTSFSSGLVFSKYVTPLGTTASGNIQYGRIGTDIGYVWISSFGESAGWGGPEIDEALKALNGIKGLIIDVRDNRGGSSDNSRAIASRFVTSKATFAFVRFRNGPSHSDFTPFYPQRVEPAGVHMAIRTAVIGNRLTASAAEAFLLAVRTNSSIVMVGDSTIGALGNPLIRELPGGWEYRFPEWMEVDANGRSIENVGIAPDEYIVNTNSTRVAGIDAQLERAIVIVR